MPCCADSLGAFEATYEVYASKREKPSGDKLSIETFYSEQALQNGSNSKQLNSELYSLDDLKAYKYFLVEVSGYFTGNYSKVDDQILTLPLKIINNVSAVNEIRVDQYPFLTYGDFSNKIDQLENFGSDNLLDEAREFYNLIERTLSAAQLKDYEVYLALADSAFAHCGRNPTSSLLFIQPGTVSSLYSSLHHIIVQDSSFREPYTNEAIQFRLGEAMDMESLMDIAYQRLADEILPKDLDVSGAVEASGYFSADSAYRQPVLMKNPVLWKEVSVPALEHFIRIHDLESADQLIGFVDEHVELLKPVWSKLADFEDKSHFEDLSSELIDYNAMLDYHLAKLQFYTITGLFEQGKKVFEQTDILYGSSLKFNPANYWLVSGRFFEELRDFEVADSLYSWLTSTSKDWLKIIQPNQANQKPSYVVLIKLPWQRR